MWGEQGCGSVPSLWSRLAVGASQHWPHPGGIKEGLLGRRKRMELFSLRQAVVPGDGWALLGTWSPQVKLGWGQDIPQVPVGMGSVGIPGASC